MAYLPQGLHFSQEEENLLGAEWHQRLLAAGGGQGGMKCSARAHLLTTANPPGTSVPGGPFSTSMMHVTHSSLVPPPAGTGPVPLALWNDLGDKAGPSPTETVGKGTEIGNPPLDKLSTVSSHGQAEHKG